MNDFDEEKKSEPQGETYYNPSKSEPTEENTTYHYSYSSSASNEPNQNSTPNSNYNQNYQNQNASPYTANGGYSQPESYYTPPVGNQNQYTPPQNEQGYASEPTQGDEKPPKKPKKNKSLIIIIIVVIVCIAAAAGGIAFSLSNSSSSGSSDTTTQSDSSSAGDVKTNDSNSVATEDSSGNLTVAGVYEKVVDSCVGITVYTQQNAYSYFYGNSSSSSDTDDSGNTKSGEGSGIIMSENNGLTYILTCAHVISSADSYTVTLNDKTEYEATMVSYDSQTDIGVLSIKATGLQTAEFADSENLAVGQQVVAIGCPGGLEFMNSMTSGYISALDRPVSSSIGYDTNCIQIDAAINPGNSGGALFNMQGQVIGVNSSKIAATEYEGMGFAIPADTAVSTANSLIKSGYVEGRAKIGITYNLLTNYNNYSSILSALEEKGYKDAKGTMVISSVDGSSDLASKDIEQYDMIVAINGTTLTSTDIMTSVLSDSNPGDTVKLTIARIENNSITIKEVSCKLMESKGSTSTSSSNSNSSGNSNSTN